MLPLTWKLPDRVLILDRQPLVMGIVNVTPDSFSDGGSYLNPEEAIAHGHRLVEEGADILDIGGESSRPGSQPISVAEELQRVLPVIEGLASRCAVPLSVDTYKAEVARRSLETGCAIVNDITALRGDEAMVEVVRSHKVGVVLMHMQGTPATMQQSPHYADVVAEVGQFFEERLKTLTGQGIPAEQIVLDPGIGFGKSSSHNRDLLARLGEYQRLGRPILLGVSRKGFLGKITGREPQQRLAASLAIVCLIALRQTAQIVRVHDVEETRDVLKVLEAIAPMR
ncbi:MAG: dihydropteroate synthase [Gemmataceae bacterium]